MLPSFRLIAATFFCGFVVVFAGLRLASSLHVIHESLPVMAAHAAPMPVAPAADRDARRSASSVPVMYDMRFAVAPVQPTLARTSPMAIDRAMPLLPLAILPPDLAPAEDTVAAQPAEPEITVAAIPPDVAVDPLPAEPSSTIIAEPLPPPSAEPEPAPDQTAAVEPAVSAQETASRDVPVAEAPAATTDSKAPPKEMAALEMTVPVPLAKPPQAAVTPKKAAAKPKPRKPRVRTALRPAARNSFDINNPASSPFGTQPH